MSMKKCLSTSIALDMLLSLTSDRDDSEIEADQDTSSEFQLLQNLDKPSKSSNTVDKANPYAKQPKKRKRFEIVHV
ncbi:hypothetical protein TNIN_305691 [Trichonephila inaurata madagascariensis]|uniref:Uncharacterized protein n=1 Tax=Trichonephila inaurata madagascariensis TaxID=2747483 RepID=A0A8X6WWV4_9ARAC|nr:hypothetical protein TNIN_305691 [Trichonephila inaurata madagascariensis]